MNRRQKEREKNVLKLTKPGWSCGGRPPVPGLPPSGHGVGVVEAHCVEARVKGGGQVVGEAGGCGA